MAAERPIPQLDRLPYSDVNRTAGRLVGEFREAFLAQPTFPETAARAWAEHQSTVDVSLGDYTYKVSSSAVFQFHLGTVGISRGPAGDNFDIRRERTTDEGLYWEQYELCTDGAPPADDNYGPDREIDIPGIPQTIGLPMYAPTVSYENSNGVHELNTQGAISAHENLLRELQGSPIGI